MNQPPNSRFKFFPQLNELDQTQWLGSADKIFLNLADKHFSSGSLQDTFVRAIAADRLMPIKEILETFEARNCLAGDRGKSPA